jgi:hypothetical protein
MERWTWVMSVDIQGRWMTTEGYAEVQIGQGRVEGRLCYSPEVEPYQHMTGTIGEDGCVVVELESPGGHAPRFGLQGTFFVGEKDDQCQAKSMVLTDGTTVLALAHGPRTHDS